jgi:ribosomal protein S18 acetylase RimI-like enzyme
MVRATMTAATPLRAAADPTTPAAGDPLSKRWLALDWSAHLPWDIGGLRIELGALEDVIGFVGRWYAEIFGSAADEGRFLTEPMTPAKRCVLGESDLFLIREAGEIVGLQVGAPTDWSTYYIRSLAVLPHARRPGILEGISQAMTAVLREHGVTRIENDTTPTNVANLLVTTRLGYMTTGTLNSERWGMLLRRTLFLESAAEDVFRGQFCAGRWSPRRNQPRTGTKGGSP